MRWFRRLWQKALTARRLDSELQFHLERQIADYVASGLPPAKPAAVPSLEFGGLERFKKECREARSISAAPSPNLALPIDAARVGRAASG